MHTMQDVFAALENLGFQTPKHGLVNQASLKAFYAQAQEERQSLDYDADGIVLSTNSLETLEDLGYADKDCPKGQIALKYPAQTSITIIREVIWSADGAAHLSPVAIFDPIELGGATITRASLKSHQWATSRSERVAYFKKSLREQGMPADEIPAAAEVWAGSEATVGVGSVVEISKQGDVIPFVKRVVSNLAGELNTPTKCPACGGPVEVNGAFIDCPDQECTGKEAARIRKFLVNLKVKGLGVDSLRVYAEAGVTLLDFFLQDGFAAVESKIQIHPEISLNVWAKIKQQLVTAQQG